MLITFLFAPYIFLYTLFYKILNLFSSLKVTNFTQPGICLTFLDVNQYFKVTLRIT